jgi:hypothetical protein
MQNPNLNTDDAHKENLSLLKRSPNRPSEAPGPRRRCELQILPLSCLGDEIQECAPEEFFNRLTDYMHGILASPQGPEELWLFLMSIGIVVSPQPSADFFRATRTLQRCQMRGTTPVYSIASQQFNCAVSGDSKSHVQLAAERLDKWLDRYGVMFRNAEVVETFSWLPIEKDVYKEARLRHNAARIRQTRARERQDKVQGAMYSQRKTAEFEEGQST